MYPTQLDSPTADSYDPARFSARSHALFDLLARYHRFETRGIEHIPRRGPALIIGTHSAITYDLFLIAESVFAATGRVIRMLADRTWFQVPRLTNWLLDYGIVEAGPQIADAVLADGSILGIAPGGMREALQPTRDRSLPDWDGRYGFVKLWLRTRAPLFLVTVPAADRAVTVYRNPLTAWLYRRLHKPLPIVRGLGPTLIPRPVKLVAHFSPQVPLDPDTPMTEAGIAAAHARVTRAMRDHISRARTAA
jgi:1-acyl-sn-glycerol-3-phosphate acyltransferase